MQDPALEMIQALRDAGQVSLFARRLCGWLLADLSGEEPPAEFGESRARALLRAADAVGDPTLGDFQSLMQNPPAARVALYDLLTASDLAQNDEVRALAAVGAQAEPEEYPDSVPWLSLALLSFAWQRGYPPQQFDPASPPERYTPAGHIVANTAHLLRQQIQRNATDREKLGKKMAWREDSAASLESLRRQEAVAPLPPHFRPPVPVRYAEMARETVRVDPGEEEPERPVSRGEPLVITEEDLPDEEESQETAQPRQARRMPPIHIDPQQVEPSQPPSPLPPSGVVVPTSTTDSRPSLTMALRQMFRTEELETTKLRVVTREHPQGPGLYGLQVKVTCRGIQSFVAGTTDRDGQFVAELPVRPREGLTYDVDVTWPREFGGETERKSITVHADRTEFTLPFHVHVHSDD